MEGNSTYCCGVVPYSYNRQICCDDNVLDLQNSRNTCCGNVLYDPSTQVCCLCSIAITMAMAMAIALAIFGNIS